MGTKPWEDEENDTYYWLKEANLERLHISGKAQTVQTRKSRDCRGRVGGGSGRGAWGL